MTLKCEDRQIDKKMVEFDSLKWGSPFETAEGLFLKINECEGFNVQECECMVFADEEKVIPREARIIFE